jgi:hypothetical protein
MRRGTIQPPTNPMLKSKIKKKNQFGEEEKNKIN